MPIVALLIQFIRSQIILKATLYSLAGSFNFIANIAPVLDALNEGIRAIINFIYSGTYPNCVFRPDLQAFYHWNFMPSIEEDGSISYPRPYAYNIPNFPESIIEGGSISHEPLPFERFALNIGSSAYIAQRSGEESIIDSEYLADEFSEVVEMEVIGGGLYQGYINVRSGSVAGAEDGDQQPIPFDGSSIELPPFMRFYSGGAFQISIFISAQLNIPTFGLLQRSYISQAANIPFYEPSQIIIGATGLTYLPPLERKIEPIEAGSILGNIFNDGGDMKRCYQGALDRAEQATALPYARSIRYIEGFEFNDGAEWQEFDPYEGKKPLLGSSIMASQGEAFYPIGAMRATRSGKKFYWDGVGWQSISQ